MLNLKNILLNTDSYKASHFLQYPPGSEYVSSYIEARGGQYPYTVFFGLQMFLMDYLSTPITQADIDEADEFWTAHGEPFNRQGWEYILNFHGGWLPVQIQAVKEGSVVDVSNVLVQLRNTDPKVPWLTSFLETALLRAVWYPTTVATRSYYIKQIIRKHLQDTGCEDVPGTLAFKLHDFGARGVSSFESAGIGGCAHLINFMGTDTATAILYAKKFYDAKQMPAFSIPAAEHSTITSWGKDNEVKAFRNMLEQFTGDGKGPLVAVVSDSYDIYNAVDNLWGDQLKAEVIALGDTGQCLVVRPDSGDPAIVAPEVVARLGAKFGYSQNRLGYKVLPKFVRVIQGDGVNEKSIDTILTRMADNFWAAENMTFGMGGEMLQTMNRDTQKWAMKANAIKFHGDAEWTKVMKDPVTMTGKRSKPGRLALVRSSGLGADTYQTWAEEDLNGRENQLGVVYENGNLLRKHTLGEIRDRTNGLT